MLRSFSTNAKSDFFFARHLAELTLALDTNDGYWRADSHDEHQDSHYAQGRRQGRLAPTPAPQLRYRADAPRANRFVPLNATQIPQLLPALRDTEDGDLSLNT